MIKFAEKCLNFTLLIKFILLFSIKHDLSYSISRIELVKSSSPLLLSAALHCPKLLTYITNHFNFEQQMSPHPDILMVNNICQLL